jgi:predicted HTH domain antitoxin
MKTMPYPVRLPKHLLELADLRAEDEQVNRSTALRQLLYAWATGYVLELFPKGRISLSKAAELLDCSTLAIVQKSQERGVVSSSTLEQYQGAKARTRSKR